MHFEERFIPLIGVETQERIVIGRESVLSKQAGGAAPSVMVNGTRRRSTFKRGKRVTDRNVMKKRRKLICVSTWDQLRRRDHVPLCLW